MYYFHHFNSTMVRLKGHFLLKIIMRLQYFNSTMVRLKDLKHMKALLNFMNFNSTMVRLKVRIDLYFAITLTRFQFHYGTIKSK